MVCIGGWVGEGVGGKVGVGRGGRGGVGESGWGVEALRAAPNLRVAPRRVMGLSFTSRHTFSAFWL